MFNTLIKYVNTAEWCNLSFYIQFVLHAPLLEVGKIPARIVILVMYN